MFSCFISTFYPAACHQTQLEVLFIEVWSNNQRSSHSCCNNFFIMMSSKMKKKCSFRGNKIKNLFMKYFQYPSRWPTDAFEGKYAPNRYLRSLSRKAFFSHTKRFFRFSFMKKFFWRNFRIPNIFWRSIVFCTQFIMRNSFLWN